MTKAEALDTVAAALHRALEKNGQDVPVSLMSGLTGIALFFFYAGRATANAAYTKTGADLVDQVFDRLNRVEALNTKRMHSLCTGLCGIAFTMFHLRKYGFIDLAFEEEFSMLDEYLAEQARTDYKKGVSDFLHGPMGVYYYFLQRYPQEPLGRYLDGMTADFLAHARHNEQGLRIRNMVLEEVHENEYDLGLAHGMAGNILIFSKGEERGYQHPQLQTIISDALKYVKSMQRDQKGPLANSLFPSSVDETYALDHDVNQNNYQSRLAWCYGDLNLAWMFIKLGKQYGAAELYERGVAIGLDTAARNAYRDHLVGDIFFCHGSSGVSYFYRRLYEESGVPAFERASDHWMDHTLERFARFPATTANPKRAFSFLEGLPGLGLTFLPAGDKSNFSWDEILLLS